MSTTTRKSGAPSASPAAASLLPSSDAPTPRPVTPADLGASRYEILGEEGRGGLGRVLRAYDRRLERVVALKELVDPTPEATARFVREVRLTARLQHPSIISIYEIAEHEDGSPFYAMKLVEGRPFQAIIASATSFEDRLELVAHAAAVADAMAYAHEHGIIHRDLKPANVLVGPFGETVVIDWGLAKDLRAPPVDVDAPPTTSPIDVASIDAAVKTRAGELLGTPAYMPPEQIRGDGVDERADVFAIGGILYQTLTGHAPYDEPSFRDAVARMTSGTPRPAKEREPRVPPELAAIVDKAMAPAKADRYRTAKELAADITRYRAGQLVDAHRYSQTHLLRRFVRKHRAAFVAAGAFLVALAAVGSIAISRVVRARDTAERARTAAEKARNEAEQRTQELTMIHARSALDRDPAQAIAWARAYPPSGPAFREVATIAAEATHRGVARWQHALFPRSWVRAMSVSSDGQRAVACDELGEIAVVELASGRVTKIHHHGNARAVAFAEDDRAVVAAGDDGALVRFDITGGGRREIAKLAGIRSLAIAGPIAIVGASDGVVHAIPLGTGPSRVLATHDGAVDQVVVGKSTVASAGRDGTVRLTSLDGTDTAIYRGERGSFRARIAAADDGAAFAVLEPSQRVTAIDRRGNVLRRFTTEHRGTIGGVAISADGARVATGGFDHTVRVFDVADGARQVLHGHTNEVSVVRFTRDGAALASSGLDGDVRLWDPKTGAATRVLRGHVKNVTALSFGASGDVASVVSADDGGDLRVWPLVEDRHRVLAGHTHDIVPMLFANGERIVTGSNDRTLRIWDATGSGRPARTAAVHTDAVRWLGIAKGETVVSAGLDDAVWGFAGALSSEGPVTGRVIARATLPIQDLATSPRASAVAIATRAGAFLVDTETSTQIRLDGHAGAVRGVSMTKDGRTVATAGEDRTIRIWDVATGAAVATLEGHSAELGSAVFAPDGARLASGDRDGNVIVWDVAKKTLLARLRGHDRRIVHMEFSPDGRTLATASNDHTVRVFAPPAPEPLATLPHDDHVAVVRFSPDGKLIASAGNDRTVRIWDRETFALRALHHQENVVTALAFSPDGSMLASAGWDRVVRIWPVDPKAMLPTDAPGLLAWMRDATNASTGP